MSTAKIRFQQSTTDQFYTELKSKVNGYFSENKISQHANFQMVLKTILLFSLTFTAYGLIIADFLPLWAMWLLCVVMGVGIAGLGFSVAHDSIHGAYSSNPKVNYLLGLTMNIIGEIAMYGALLTMLFITHTLIFTNMMRILSWRPSSGCQSTRSTKLSTDISMYLPL